MNLNQYAKIEAVKSLDIRVALEFYGVEFNRHGFARCPFHSEKTASFKLYNNKFKCFGCGVSGDLIHFVQKKFKLHFYDAVDAICRDFKINATPNIADLRRSDEIKIKKFREKKNYTKLLVRKNDILELYLAAASLCEAAAKLPSGATVDNDIYADAKFCELEAAALLEEAEAECIEYAHEHPGALPIPPVLHDWPELSWNDEAQQIINRLNFTSNSKK